VALLVTAFTHGTNLKGGTAAGEGQHTHCASTTEAGRVQWALGRLCLLQVRGTVSGGLCVDDASTASSPASSAARRSFPDSKRTHTHRGAHEDASTKVPAARWSRCAGQCCRRRGSQPWLDHCALRCCCIVDVADATARRGTTANLPTSTPAAGQATTSSTCHAQIGTCRHTARLLIALRLREPRWVSDFSKLMCWPCSFPQC
jgi:hypothetical protein